MSIETMTAVLHHSKASGTAKLVLLGIANHDGDGGAWPTVATLAKYANTNPRAVQKAVKRLEELREVRRNVQAGGNAAISDFQRPNLYEVTVMCPADCDRTKHHRTRRRPGFSDPLSLGTPGVLEDRGGMSTGTGEGVSTGTPKPSIEPITHLPEKNLSNRARALGVTEQQLLEAGIA